MIDVVFVYYLVFGALTAVGGYVGYRRANSKASLIAGCAAGGLLVLAALLVSRWWTMPALLIGLGVSLILAGRFVRAFIQTKKPMPAGLMSALSVIGIVLSIAALARL